VSPSVVNVKRAKLVPQLSGTWAWVTSFANLVCSKTLTKTLVSLWPFPAICDVFIGCFNDTGGVIYFVVYARINFLLVGEFDCVWFDEFIFAHLLYLAVFLSSGDVQH
jgi:hypothetical protein